MVARRGGRLLVAAVLVAAVPTASAGQVTAVLDKASYRDGEQIWLTVTTAGRRLARPRVYTQARPGPVDLDSPLRDEFGPIDGTARLAVQAPSYVIGNLDSGAPYVLGPGAWTLYLYDGRRLVARVPFTMLPRSDHESVPVAGGDVSPRRRVLERVEGGPLTRGRAFTVAVYRAGDLGKAALVLQWAMAPVTGGTRPPEPPGAFSGAVPVPPGDGQRTVEVFAPYAVGRFELRLMSGDAAVESLLVEVR